MFEKYLEKEHTRRIAILTLLWQNDHLTSLDLSHAIGVTSVTVKSDIKYINLHYSEQDSQLIVSGHFGYTILQKDRRQKENYIQKIYKDSVFIRACCFFLKKKKFRVGEFASQEFISVSKAYVLKEQVFTYLNELNIPSENKSGELECRYRFLLAFFKMKVGIDCVKVHKYNQYRFELLFKEVEKKERCLFSNYSKEYASTLFQLYYDRHKKFQLSFEDNAASILKNTYMYKSLSKTIECFLKNELNTRIAEEEILYYILVFLVMNANYFHKEKLESYLVYSDMIVNSDRLNYDKLLHLFEEEFNQRLRGNLIFEVSLINFVKKCLFDLQRFIPEEHNELGTIAEIPQEIFKRIKLLFLRWNEEEALGVGFSDDHIAYFVSKVFFLIRKVESPKKVYLLTSFYTDYLLAEEIMRQEFGSIIIVEQFDLEKSYFEYNEEDLILYDSDYSLLNRIKCKKMKISFVFDLKEIQKIREKVSSFNLIGFHRKT